MTSESPTKTLARGLEVLQAIFQAGTRGLHLTEVAERTGLNRSTAYRYLDTLEASGLIREINIPRFYVFDDGRYLRQRLDDHYQPYLRAAARRIAVATGVSCFLLRRNGDFFRCVCSEHGHAYIQCPIPCPGDEYPLASTAGGLVLLGHLPEDEGAAIVERNLRMLPRHWIMQAHRHQRWRRIASRRKTLIIKTSLTAIWPTIGVAVPRAWGAPVFAMEVLYFSDDIPAAQKQRTLKIMRLEIEAALQIPPPRLDAYVAGDVQEMNSARDGAWHPSDIVRPEPAYYF
ncbi:MAG: helix-turn-helix domain-containing protein [Castellaniella sp.]